MNDRLVWIDCEMTGLDLRRDALVEVAALVTDSELNVLGEGIDLVIRPPDDALAQMEEVVRTMHTASGLLEAPLAGNTVATDRGFLARDMPGLESHLHYRIVDVSSIKELARRWYPRVYYNSPVKSGNHRALADIRESIEELKYYRAAIFVPQPGPDSATAKSLAEDFTIPPGPRSGAGAGAGDKASAVNGPAGPR